MSELRVRGFCKRFQEDINLDRLASDSNANKVPKYFTVATSASFDRVICVCVGFVAPLSVIFVLNTADITTNNDRTIANIVIILEKKSLSSSAFWLAMFTYLSYLL